MHEGYQIHDLLNVRIKGNDKTDDLWAMRSHFTLYHELMSRV